MNTETITTATFGPGGNGEWFYADGKKSTTQSPDPERHMGRSAPIIN